MFSRTTRSIENVLFSAERVERFHSTHLKVQSVFEADRCKEEGGKNRSSFRVVECVIRETQIAPPLSSLLPSVRMPMFGSDRVSSIRLSVSFQANSVEVDGPHRSEDRQIREVAH